MPTLITKMQIDEDDILLVINKIREALESEEFEITPECTIYRCVEKGVREGMGIFSNKMVKQWMKYSPHYRGERGEKGE